MLTAFPEIFKGLHDPVSTTSRNVPNLRSVEMSPLLSHLSDFLVLRIRQLLNKEFGIFPEYLQGPIEQHPDKHFAFGARQGLVALRIWNSRFSKRTT